MKKTKKFLCSLLTLPMLISSINIAMAKVGDNIKVKLNGEIITFDVQPQLVNSRTMVPMRTIFEKLGAEVNWDHKNQKVTATTENTTVELQIDNPIMKINGEPITLDVPALIVDSRTLVPVRAVSESLNVIVNWDDASQTVLLEEYKTPIILLHGLNSNTATCFGVKTTVKNSGKFSYIEKDTYDDEQFKKCETHKITGIESSNKLGKYLTENLDYKINKNLFAFNYPNGDVVQLNALRLEGYIKDLIETAKNDPNDTVDKNYLLPPNGDDVKFILIGHSMGGLVSRYYTENLRHSECVEKIITIDTPHYGSGWADYFSSTDVDSLKSSYNNFVSKSGIPLPPFSPAIVELHKESTLFTGELKYYDLNPKISESNDTEADELKKIVKQLNNYQTNILHGNTNIPVKYYAIAGYDVNISIGDKLDAEKLQDTIFSFELTRDVSSKENFKKSINSYLQSSTGSSSSHLGLNDTSGDLIVNYMSQLGVDFEPHKTEEYLKFNRTTMIVNSGSPSLFHSTILQEPELFNWVETFIND